MDTVTPEKRSWVMSRIRSTNTKPEMAVRSMLHGMGLRFRLHGRVSKRIHRKGILPGKPDIVLASRRTVVFVHGCFWHRHEGCRLVSTPKTNQEFWNAKFERNVERDKRHCLELEDMGWRVIIVWECELRSLETLAERLQQLLLGKTPPVIPYGKAEPDDLPMVAEESAEYHTGEDSEE